jgi:hypothetical protein
MDQLWRRTVSIWVLFTVFCDFLSLFYVCLCALLWTFSPFFYVCLCALL